MPAPLPPPAIRCHRGSPPLTQVAANRLEPRTFPSPIVGETGDGEGAARECPRGPSTPTTPRIFGHCPACHGESHPPTPAVHGRSRFRLLSPFGCGVLYPSMLFPDLPSPWATHPVPASPLGHTVRGGCSLVATGNCASTEPCFFPACQSVLLAVMPPSPLGLVASLPQAGGFSFLYPAAR